LKKGFPQANVLIFHAVTAVKSDGMESFFSNLAQNNDRDHDDYCLGIDGFFLLKSGEVAAGKPLTQNTCKHTVKKGGGNVTGNKMLPIS